MSLNNWVSQEDTRLAGARDDASHVGLTRAEVTFYCQNDIQSVEIMEATLKRTVRYVEASGVYKTLVVVNKTKDTALIVYSYNELTQNISGECINK